MANRGQSHRVFSGKLLPAKETIEAIVQAASGSDFVGLYSGGPIHRASRNSLGQKHWFSTENFFVDYSLFSKNVDGDNKAVKGVFAGLNWDQKLFQNRLQTSQNQLALMGRKTQKIPRGKYRTYLAPSAVAEILGTMSWGAFSMKSLKQGHCGLAKLHEAERSLSPLLSIHENFNLGLCPQFNSLGEMAPDSLALIEKGQSQNLLVSTRSAKEYDVVANGALSETLRSTEILPGHLNEVDILKSLGTGLYLSNLHYINWSDIPNARITGMTRYACFWVEKGEIVGPIQDLRFDDSLFSLLGSQLEALTSFREIDPDIMTYMQRGLGGKNLPGLLVREMSFTL
jgi:predicted Zn-dependent protease